MICEFSCWHEHYLFYFNLIFWIQTCNFIFYNVFFRHGKIKPTCLLTVCYYHITYAFQSKSRLLSRELIECGFALKRVPDMMITYGQMHRTDKYSQHNSTHNSTICPVWLSARLWTSYCRFELSWSHLNFRFRVSFK